MVKWKIDYLEQDDVVFVKLLRKINIEDVKQICVDVFSLQLKRRSNKCLLDHRGVEISLKDLYKMPEALKEVGIDYESKVAMLDNRTPGIERFGLVKDVLSKASVRLELFSDSNEAIAWLKSD